MLANADCEIKQEARLVIEAYASVHSNTQSQPYFKIAFSQSKLIISIQR